MDRNDLAPEMNGWQVLDPTPQQRSRGVEVTLSFLLYRNVLPEC